MNKTVGYLGPQGSFSQAACLSLYQHSNAKLIAFPNLNALLQALMQGEISHALMPIRNSKNGLLKDKAGVEFINYLIAPNSTLKVVGEKLWPLYFTLLGIPQSSKLAVTTVHINEYAQQLCRPYFQRHAWRVETHASSSEAAKFVSQLNQPEHAALASAEAAHQYGLDVLDSAIFVRAEDWPVMHFLVLTQAAEETAVTDNIASLFVIQTNKQAQMRQALQTSGLDIYYCYKASDAPDRYLLDINGPIAQDILQTVLPFTKVRQIGCYAVSVKAREASKLQFMRFNF